MSAPLALPLPAVAPALLLVLLLLVLLLLVLLLLHAAISSAEVTATTAAMVFLIRASFLAGARSAGRRNLNLLESQCGY